MSWEQDIMDALHRSTGGHLVTGFVVVAETLDDQGHRQLKVFRDVTPWTAIGWLDYAQNKLHNPIRTTE